VIKGPTHARRPSTHSLNHERQNAACLVNTRRLMAFSPWLIPQQADPAQPYTQNTQIHGYQYADVNTSKRNDMRAEPSRTVGTA
jgi:hypothetical protein